MNSESSPGEKYTLCRVEDVPSADRIPSEGSWYSYLILPPGSVNNPGNTYRWICHAAAHLLRTPIGGTVASRKTTGRWHFHFIRRRVHRHCHAAADEVLLQLERPGGVESGWRVNFEALTGTGLARVLHAGHQQIKSTWFLLSTPAISRPLIFCVGPFFFSLFITFFSPYPLYFLRNMLGNQLIELFYLFVVDFGRVCVGTRCEKLRKKAQ